MSHPTFELRLSWGCDNIPKQAGDELGQAQLKLGLGFALINLRQIYDQEMLTSTNH